MDYFAVVKAFGDLVITQASLQRVSGLPPPLLVGQHLLALNNVLGARTPATVWSHQEDGVPAMFDARRCGVRQALRSVVGLRNGFSKLQISRRSRVFFAHDAFFPREQLITGGLAHPIFMHQRPGCGGNIYLEYEKRLSILGFSLRPPTVADNVLGCREAIVIPGARMAHRVLPPSVISEIAKLLVSHGMNATVVSLEGETAQLPVDVQTLKIPRQFGALVETIRNASMVVCADSLPSHLGEYLGKPTFVATPKPKMYWLPRLCFLDHGWCTFGDLNPLRVWLNRWQLL